MKSDEHLNSSGKKDGPDEVTVDGIALWVHPSGERLAIRMRDEQGEMARAFEGFHWFPIRQYRVVGRFIKDAGAAARCTPSISWTTTTCTRPKAWSSSRSNGETVRLRPMTTRPNRLYFIFRDGTSGKETYDTARFLYSDLATTGRRCSISTRPTTRRARSIRSRRARCRAGESPEGPHPGGREHTASPDHEGRSDAVPRPPR